MNLLEYQAKQIFQEWGIPVLPSQCIENPSQIKQLQIPYPVVLKSQVRASGREPLGGIKFVGNTIDAIAAANAIFHQPILGEFPQVILAESQYNPTQEFFLAVVLDYELGMPVLFGSRQSGNDLQLVQEQLQKVVVEQQFSSFYARRLAIKMGLSGSLIESVAQIVEKMYRIFIQNDLDLIEINPLGIDQAGVPMALDGKIIVNDQALDRHPELAELAKQNTPVADWRDGWGRWQIFNPTGTVAVIANNLGLVATGLDLLHFNKIKAAGYLVFADDQLPGKTKQELLTALEQINQLTELEAVLLCIVGNPALAEQVAATLTEYLKIHQSICSSGDRTERPTATRAVRRATDRPTSNAMPRFVAYLSEVSGRPGSRWLSAGNLTEAIHQIHAPHSNQ